MKTYLGGSNNRRPISLRTLGGNSRRKDPRCYGPLAERSVKRAEEEYRNSFSVDLLDGKLQCECGASVGAVRLDSGEFKPTYHLPYKEPRRLVNPSGKSGYYKR